MTNTADGQPYSLADLLMAIRRAALFSVLGRGEMAGWLLDNLEVDISETQRLLAW